MERFKLVDIYSVGRGDSKRYYLAIYSTMTHTTSPVKIDTNDISKYSDLLDTDVTEMITFWLNRDNVRFLQLKTE